MNDSLPFDVEFDLRLVGCELIQTSGRLLKLPQTAMATAQVIFHRFYYIKSFVKNSMEYHAMASIYLSSKIEESPRRIRDVLNVFHHIKQVRTGKLITPMAVDENYANTKNQVIKAERRILKELGFCVHVKHPHKIIFLYLQALECAQSSLSQKAWNYMNDALRTDVFLRYSAEKIACACIYLSARELQIPLPESPPWYVIFGADEQSIKAICVRILHLYTHEVRTQDELEKLVQKCRDNIEAERALRNKLLLNTALAAAKEAAAQHLAKKSAATTAATATDSPSSTGTPTSTDKDAATAAAATKPPLTSTTSASSLLKSFEKTKSIHSSMSASGLNGNSTNLAAAATQQRPSPPNPYYLGNSSYHQHPHSHPHHLATSVSGRYPPHQNGHSNGNPPDVHMMPLAAENGGMPIRRDKSSSHLSSRYDEEYEQSKKRKDYSSKDIKHKNRSRTRSRSPSAKRKSRKKSRTRSRSRDRSNSVDIGEESMDLKSGSAASRHHKKKKSHHRRSSRSRSRTRSRSKEPSETTTKTDYRSESKKVGSGSGGRSEKDRDRERYDKERSRDKERSSDATKERKYYENSRHHSSKSIKS